MQPVILFFAFVLAALAVVAAFAATLVVTAKSNKRSYALAAVLSLLLIVAATYGVGIGEPTTNVVRTILKSAADKNLVTIFACLSGSLAGIAVSLSLFKDGTGRLMQSFVFAAAALAAIVSFVGNSNSSPNAKIARKTAKLSCVAEDVIVEEIHETSFYPIRIAVRGEDIFCAGVSDVISWHGVVVKLSPKPDGSGYEEQVIVRGVDRPCGIAIDGDRILLSRSGKWHRAVNGVLQPQSTGSVSELVDFDGDGIIDRVVDILDGLPGARTPETQHQNGAIAVGPDGRLYVGQGVRSDDSFDPDENAGTVLVADADGSNMQVFASGFRNPFGLCFGPFEKLYSTDNDPDKNQEGEELNLVTSKGNYGFPMSHGGVDAPEGTIKPIALHYGGELQGMAYNDSETLPDEFRDCLYIASTGSNKILRAEVKKGDAGDDFTAEITEFANIPSPLDVATNEKGVIYSSSFSGKKIYRLKFETKRN